MSLRAKYLPSFVSKSVDFDAICHVLLANVLGVAMRTLEFLRPEIWMIYYYEKSRIFSKLKH